MITLKKGVHLRGLRPEISTAITIVASIYDSHGLDTIVTSVVDGVHSLASKHYSGSAVDFRTRHIPAGKTKTQIANMAQEALGDDFFVLLEETHLHVQYEPKGPIET